MCFCLNIEILYFFRRPRPDMEKNLHNRDLVGVQDFILLENFQSEEAFIDNLRKRYKENLIYVSCFIKFKNII